MPQDPASRRYVPSEIWRQGYNPNDLGCYISNEQFVLGRCGACEACQCLAGIEKIELVPCSKIRSCLRCGLRTAHGDKIIIATDGACRNNGYPNAHASIGVFCNTNSKRNKAIVINESRLTSQRAELWAAMYALKMARNMFATRKIVSHVREVVIKSDSVCVVNSMVCWVANWRQNGYVNARGDPIVNQDLFESLDLICECLDNMGVQVRFWLVPREQNMQADKLANAALDLVDWQSFSEDDWFEGGEKPRIYYPLITNPECNFGTLLWPRSIHDGCCYRN